MAIVKPEECLFYKPQQFTSANNLRALRIPGGGGLDCDPVLLVYQSFGGRSGAARDSLQEDMSELRRFIGDTTYSASTANRPTRNYSLYGRLDSKSKGIVDGARLDQSKAIQNKAQFEQTYKDSLRRIEQENK